MEKGEPQGCERSVEQGCGVERRGLAPKPGGGCQGGFPGETAFKGMVEF